VGFAAWVSERRRIVALRLTQRSRARTIQIVAMS